MAKLTRHQPRVRARAVGADGSASAEAGDVGKEWGPIVETEAEVLELTEEERQISEEECIDDKDAREEDPEIEELATLFDEPFLMEGKNGEEIVVGAGIKDQHYEDRRAFEDKEELEKTKQFGVAMAVVADELKCQDIRLLDVHTKRDWTDYFIILSAMSRTQLRAVLGKMEKVAKEGWGVDAQDTITRNSEWECIDFGNLIVHAFSPRARTYYRLEQLYLDCKEVRTLIKKLLSDAHYGCRFLSSLKKSLSVKNGHRLIKRMLLDKDYRPQLFFKSTCLLSMVSVAIVLNDLNSAYNTSRLLFKIPDLMETLCEDYGQIAKYKGTIPGHENAYELDECHCFEKNKPMLVSGNTATMVGENGVSWLSPHFEIIGDRSVHYGLFPDCGPTGTALTPTPQNNAAANGASCSG